MLSPLSRVTVASGQVFPPLNSYFMISLCFSIALVKSDIYAKNSFLVYIILRKGFFRKKIIVKKLRKAENLSLLF
jgi:hypothetical protein